MMSSIEKLPIFVISMASETDRRVRITQILGDLGLNFEFFDATDGREFDVTNHSEYDRKRRLRYYGRDLLPAELGCTSSHKRIYQHIIEHDLEQALIFEDDIILYDNFLPTLKALISNCPVPYELVRFMGRDKVMKAKQRRVCKLADDTWLTRFPGTPGDAHAYIITHKGAKKMLAHLDKTYFPIDVLMGRSWQTGLNWFSIYPKTAYQNHDFDSSIGNERFNKKPQVTGMARIFYPFFRFWFRICEAFGKKYWYARTYFKDKKYG